MRLMSVATLVLFFSLLAAQPVTAPPELSDSWVIEKLTRGGAVHEDAVGKVISIRAHELVSDLDPGKTSLIAVDATKEPGWFDITDGDQIVQKGIYRLDGDALTLCMAEMESERPREFASPTGSTATLIELTRKPRVE